MYSRIFRFFSRGLSNINYELIPSPARYNLKDKKRQEDFERKLLKYFKREAPISYDKTPKNYLEWLELAQHHSIPTRLMDWSFNPIVTLLFSVENNDNFDCCIYKSYLFSGIVTYELNRIFGNEFFFLKICDIQIFINGLHTNFSLSLILQR